MTIERGRKLLVAGQHHETLKFLEEAIQQFPEDAEIRLLYATILLEFQPDDVAVHALQAAEMSPDDPIILVRAGGLLLNRGEADSARFCLKRARELAGDNFILMPGLLNREGLLAMLDQNFELAEQNLRAAVESEPTSEPFAIDLVRFLVVRGRHEEAVEVIDQTLTLVENKDALRGIRRKLMADQLDD
ncbi:MAG: hypothetical protein M3335_00885 [Actinomycetota bacterium]|nr:hypothetical protein [Actinomycetota bacterium]